MSKAISANESREDEARIERVLGNEVRDHIEMEVNEDSSVKQEKNFSGDSGKGTSRARSERRTGLGAAHSYLPRVLHTPEDDEGIESYAKGVVTGVMRSATPNVVGSLLARIRQMVDQNRINDALMLEGSQKINELRDENAQLKEHVKDLNHDIQAAVNEANWQSKQGEDYGSY